MSQQLWARAMERTAPGDKPAKVTGSAVASAPGARKHGMRSARTCTGEPDSHSEDASSSSRRSSSRIVSRTTRRSSSSERFGSHSKTMPTLVPLVTCTTERRAWAPGDARHRRPPIAGHEGHRRASQGIAAHAGRRAPQCVALTSCVPRLGYQTKRHAKSGIVVAAAHDRLPDHGRQMPRRRSRACTTSVRACQRQSMMPTRRMHAGLDGRGKGPPASARHKGVDAVPD